MSKFYGRGFELVKRNSFRERRVAFALLYGAEAVHTSRTMSVRIKVFARLTLPSKICARRRLGGLCYHGAPFSPPHRAARSEWVEEFTSRTGSRHHARPRGRRARTGRPARSAVAAAGRADGRAAAANGRRRRSSVVAEEQPPPAYIHQGVLVEKLSGEVVRAEAADQQYNPASAVKLVTALAALRTFGAKHRFATSHLDHRQLRQGDRHGQRRPHRLGARPFVPRRARRRRRARAEPTRHPCRDGRPRRRPALHDELQRVFAAFGRALLRHARLGAAAGRGDARVVRLARGGARRRGAQDDAERRRDGRRLRGRRAEGRALHLDALLAAARRRAQGLALLLEQLHGRAARRPVGRRARPDAPALERPRLQGRRVPPRHGERPRHRTA